MKALSHKPTWFSNNPSKRWGEIFFLVFSALWMAPFVAIVSTEAYKNWADRGFMALGLAVSLPAVVIPLVFPGKADRLIPLTHRYWLKANLWLFLFGFVGNYFWTHYFYTLLGATYSFPVEWQLNKVPIFLFLVTHAYFISYHAFTTPVLRRFWTSNFAKNLPTFVRKLFTVFLVVAMAYFTAFMEAWTLEYVPYYQIRDRHQMYLVGSTFYMLYFVVSFPMFTRIDETGDSQQWNLSRTSLESLGSAMIVFILCDFWRLLIGGLKLQGVNADDVPFIPK